MSRGRHGRGFHQIKKKKKTKRQQAEPIAHQAIASQPVEPAAPTTEERMVEAAGQIEKPVAKQGRNTAMLADLKMAAVLAAVMLVVLIVLAQVMG